MKRRQTINKDNLILYTVVILLAVLTIWGLLYKIKEGMMIREWKTWVEEPNTAEDYASNEESKFIEKSYDKFIFTGRIDAWPKRFYCFECTGNGRECYYVTEELLPIRMEVGDMVKITGEISWGSVECIHTDSVIKSIDSIKFVNEEVYIASIPEINRIDKNHILQPTATHDYIYYYYEETDEIIADFYNTIPIEEENYVLEIDKKDMGEVYGYYYVKKDGKIYKYKCKTRLFIDGKEEYYYFNTDNPYKEMDKVFKRQRDEDVFFRYIVDPDIMEGRKGSE
ncbi:MAG: hypothetical protein HDR00_09995 [Lachnospiraceae bacterium]|nr:hypothetical protein [Lachnospiraceae bacterium]